MRGVDIFIYIGQLNTANVLYLINLKTTTFILSSARMLCKVPRTALSDGRRVIQTFLNTAADNEYYLFLEHDAHNEIITLKHTEKGVRLDNTYTFNELFN